MAQAADSEIATEFRLVVDRRNKQSVRVDGVHLAVTGKGAAFISAGLYATVGVLVEYRLAEREVGNVCKVIWNDAKVPDRLDSVLDAFPDLVEKAKRIKEQGGQDLVRASEYLSSVVGKRHGGVELKLSKDDVAIILEDGCWWVSEEGARRICERTNSIEVSCYVGPEKSPHEVSSAAILDRISLRMTPPPEGSTGTGVLLSWNGVPDRIKYLPNWALEPLHSLGVQFPHQTETGVSVSGALLLVCCSGLEVQVVRHVQQILLDALSGDLGETNPPSDQVDLSEFSGGIFSS